MWYRKVYQASFNLWITLLIFYLTVILTHMKKIIIVAVFFVVLLSAISVYDRCLLSWGSKSYGDYSVSNRSACYEERMQAGEWKLCEKHSVVSGMCLAKSSIVLSKYLCDKTSSNFTEKSCNKTLLDELKSNIKIIKGVEEYKKYGYIPIIPTTKLFGNPVKITSEGQINFFLSQQEYCLGKYDPPYIPYGIDQGNYIFITDCSVSGEKTGISYYRYAFNGIPFPDFILRTSP